MNEDDYGWKAFVTLKRWSWFILISGIWLGLIFLFLIPSTTIFGNEPGSQRLISFIIGLSIVIGFILYSCFIFGVLQSFMTMLQGISQALKRLDDLEKLIKQK